MLELTDWSVRRGSRVVLSELFLKIRPGEVVGLAGPSSGGKSSLLLSIGGRLEGCGGTARWRRQVVDLRDPALRSRVELVSEAGLGAASLTIREHLAYHAAARNLDEPDLDGALREAGLSKLADQVVATLSSGIQERLLLARAVLNRPSLVLIDHPLAHLDAVGEMILASWIERCRDRGASVMWACTDKGRLRSYCDRLLILASGSLSDSPSEAGWRGQVAAQGTGT